MPHRPRIRVLFHGLPLCDPAIGSGLGSPLSFLVDAICQSHGPHIDCSDNLSRLAPSQPQPEALLLEFDAKPRPQLS